MTPRPSLSALVSWKRLRMVDAEEITTVIVNNRLTPRQNVNLEEVLGVRVIDRMQLILISCHASSKPEGNLQVHFGSAQVSFAPRLVGQGIMLSRQAGGIGPRGPGESQLELNRRVFVTKSQISSASQAVEKIGRQSEKTSGVKHL